jgi:hypothetical protein
MKRKAPPARWVIRLTDGRFVVGIVYPCIISPDTNGTSGSDRVQIAADVWLELGSDPRHAVSIAWHHEESAMHTATLLRNAGHPCEAIDAATVKPPPYVSPEETPEPVSCAPATKLGQQELFR